MCSVAGSFKAAAVAYLVACDASAVAMLHRDSSLRSARINSTVPPNRLAEPTQRARSHGDRRGPPQLVILR